MVDLEIKEDVIERARRNRSSALKAVRIDGLSLRNIDYELRNDLEIASTAIRQNPGAIAYVNGQTRRRILGEI